MASHVWHSESFSLAVNRLVSESALHDSTTIRREGSPGPGQYPHRDVLSEPDLTRASGKWLRKPSSPPRRPAPPNVEGLKGKHAGQACRVGA